MLFDIVRAFFVNAVPSLASEVATTFLTDLMLSMSNEAEEIDELYVFLKHTVWLFCCFRRIFIQVFLDTNFREHAKWVVHDFRDALSIVPFRFRFVGQTKILKI